MKKILLVIAILYLAACSSDVVKYESTPEIKYFIDVKNHQDDLFHITVNTINLSPENNIYNMAATAPGTYKVMDFGRFVKSIKAYDEKGDEIKLERLSDNQWKIEDPENLVKLVYDTEDTFDAKIENHEVSPMCGSGIEDNFISMNTFAVLGYFEGLQSNPVKLKVDYDPAWEIGTALEINTEGYYTAETYDNLADSPILMGELSVAGTKVNDIPVEIYVYSTDTAVTAVKIMGLADEVLQSASGFIGYSPAPHYTFLMALIDQESFARNKMYGAGALEHNLSSLYVMPVSEQELGSLRSTMAHEFLHILTPLNLHSEIIQQFNFIVPTPSEHIWLYEGVTEWATDIMQLRGGIMDYDTYMRQISQKMNINSNYNQNISLTEMSLESYAEDGWGQFINFYNRGALTAACLDIELLELSGGKIGLRETFLSLIKQYGKYKPFSEDDFFNIFVKETYPEIESFIEKYIKGKEQLPCDKYFAKLGFKFIPEMISDDKRPSIGVNISLNEKKEIIFNQVSDETAKFGLRDGDIPLEIINEEVTFLSLRDILAKIYTMNVGDSYEIKVRRDDKEVTINGKLLQRKRRNVFEEMTELTEGQKALREAWSKNL